MKNVKSIKKCEDDGHIFWEAWTKTGFCWGDHGLHVTHEDTKKEILKKKWIIMKCTCLECKKNI